MDENTLLMHRSSWVEEEPCLRGLPNLTEQEQRLYQALAHNHFGEKVRLEQEHISTSSYS
jgi:hypothetical protein